MKTFILILTLIGQGGVASMGNLTAMQCMDIGEAWVTNVNNTRWTESKSFYMCVQQ